MPSRTPETLTAVQRAQRLNLHPTGKQVEADTPHQIPPVMNAALKSPSKQEQKIIQQARATLPPIGGHRSATVDIDPRRDANLSLMVLPIDQIDLYRYNPRTGPNPNHEQIKASIRADGITNTLTVTRPDPHGKYTTYGGGNTRLRIAKELYAEGDERFANLQVVYKEWPGDAQVITAHLVENENRADITFWEKAQGVQMFKTEFERENGKPLTAGELNRQLKARGLNYGIKTLQNFAFVVEHLAPVGPWLKAREVNELLRPRLAALLELGAKLGHAPALRQRLLEVMAEHATLLRERAKQNEDLDPPDRLSVELNESALLADLEGALAELEPLDVSRLAAMQAALAADPRMTPEALRAVHASPTALLPPMPSLEVGAAEQSALPQRDTAPQQGRSADAPPAIPREAQVPLAGMLAGVAPTAVPPSGSPQPKASPALQDLIAAIYGHLNKISQTVALHDLLCQGNAAPFGFLVDLPKVDVAHVDETPVDAPVAAMRASLWAVLVSISGQADRRISARFAKDPNSEWGHLVAQGEAVFAPECERRTGVRTANGALFWDAGDLMRVLASPTIGASFIGLLASMEQLRTHFGERVPSDYVPLFNREQEGES